MTNAMELWKPKEFNASSNVEWWDSMASQMSNREKPLAENNFTMKLITKNQMVQSGGTVLDVGCGGGRYSFALSDMGAVVTGIDVSPKMIEAANKNAEGYQNLTFENVDWHSLDIDSKGWRGSFDLVLANMTPAIIDSKSFVKMIEVSRNWCLMVKPLNRKNSLYDKLTALVSAPSDRATNDVTVEYAFSILWNRGLRPLMAYDKQEWFSKKPIELAIDQYTKRIGTFHTLDDEMKGKIRDFITAQEVDGQVEEITNTEIVALYWQCR